jgi:hypothetical protein
VRVVGQSVDLAQHRVSIGYHKGEKVYIVRTVRAPLHGTRLFYRVWIFDLTLYRCSDMVAAVVL